MYSQYLDQETYHEQHPRVMLQIRDTNTYVSINVHIVVCYLTTRVSSDKCIIKRFHHLCTLESTLTQTKMATVSLGNTILWDCHHICGPWLSHCCVARDCMYMQIHAHVWDINISAFQKPAFQSCLESLLPLKGIHKSKD